MTMSNGFTTRGWFLVAAAGLLTTACGGGHRLADYDFRGRTIAVVHYAPASPELYTGGRGVSSDNAIIAVLEAGSAVAVELESRRARARLDSAAMYVDVAERMADRTLDRATRYLGTRPVETEDEADYLLEVDVEKYGIDASGGGAATLFVEGEAILLDARSGREIWSREVSAWDRLTPSVTGPGSGATETILTAAALTRITVAEFQRVLEQLADYAADVMTDELREDLRDAREERR
ncbi:MAG TPA: hypothetical protein VMN78_05745 [Longimicrobiales bacterium]|nr:hypothetical protein [Longimicrobiales bacterium]